MQRVPLDRLLIQPTVQLKWIEQHREIEFLISTRLQNEFSELWSKLGTARFADFVQSEHATEYQLHNRDHLFALLTGADYIRALHPSFAIKAHQPNLLWTI